MSNIEDLKRKLQYSEEQYKIAKNNFEYCKKSLEDAQIEFRIGEVERVLEGMHTLISIGAVNERNFDNYIVHCLNCLHGNIDGSVISIEYDRGTSKELPSSRNRRTQGREVD